MKKILSPAYSLKLKTIILFLTRGIIFIFFQNGHSHNVVSTLPNVVKICVENDNVVQMKMIIYVENDNFVQIRVEIQSWNSVDSTVLNVLNLNVDVHNVASTLI